VEPDDAEEDTTPSGRRTDPPPGPHLIDAIVLAIVLALLGVLVLALLVRR
jgi:hypothetical protein